jgi:hypothetical protein
MSRKKNVNRGSRPHATRARLDYKPPGWLSTEELEQELFSAIVTDSVPRAKANFERIDVYFARDEPETEIEYRRSLLRLLADLRPQLAELVGGHRTCEE